MRTTGRLWQVIFVAAVAGASSCSPARHAAMQLDRVARSIDRYGFASISTPFLAGASDEFKFDLDKSASEFFDMALGNVQGGVRNLDSMAVDAQLAVRVNIEQALAVMAEAMKAQGLAEFNIAKSKAGVQKSMLESLAATNPGLRSTALVTSTIGMLGVLAEAPAPELPEFTPTTEGLPDVGPPFTAEQRTALGAVGATFTAPRPFPEQAFSLSAREALMIASGDVTTQSLLRWFNKPHGNKQREYELFFCPMVVSAQPGYQTRDRYLADITVNVDLARPLCRCADRGSCTCPQGGRLEYLSDRFTDSSPPIQVAGVFPVIDSQVLDLVSSRRRLYSMAFQLSLLGFGQQADFFSDYARKLEQDAQTRTALTAASAYTVGDTAFGFRVEPKFVASKDPTQLITEPGRILESRTFPAMAAVLVDRRYLKRSSHRAPCLGDETCDVPCSRTDTSGDVDEFDYLVFETSTRWAPMTESHRVFGGRLSWGGRFSEVESWKRSLALDRAEGILDNTTALGDIDERFQKRHLASRAKVLRRVALDSRAVVRVYDSAPEKRICVASVSPARGWLDQITVLTLNGCGFRGNVASVTVGGIPSVFHVPNDSTLLVLVPPWAQAKKELPKNVEQFSQVFEKIASAGMPVPGETVKSLIVDLPDDAQGKGQVLNPCDDDTEESSSKLNVPPPSLTEHEKKLLEAFQKRVAECKACKEKPDEERATACDIGPGGPNGKWEFYNRLKTKDVKYQDWVAYHAWKTECNRQVRRKEQARESAWGQIVIGASVPVLRPVGKVASCCGPTECEPFPSSERVSDDNGKQSPESNADNGWVKFEKAVSGGGSKKDSSGEVTIKRDKEGRITGIKSGAGGFGNAAQLLQLVTDELCCEGDSFSLEIGASGSTNFKAGSGPKKNCDGKPASSSPPAAQASSGASTSQ